MTKFKRSSKAVAACYLFVMGVALVTGFQNCAPGFEMTPEAAYSVASKGVDPLEIQASTATPSNAKTQAFAFKPALTRASEVVSYQCSFDSSAMASCSNPATLSDLKEGSHHLEVTGINAMGFPVVAGSYDFLVDLSPPVVTINSFPGLINGSAILDTTFSAVDALTAAASYECAIDGAAATACASPLSVPNLTDGAHSFTVVGIDKVGNKSTPVTRSWTVSALAPNLSVTPPAPTYGASISISFTATTASRVSVTTTCSLDGGTAAPCTSPFTASGLSDGNHSLLVTATDVVGHQAMSTAQWYADVRAPVVAFTTAQNTMTNLNAFPVAFTSIDARSTVASCTCDTGTSTTTCTSPFSVPYTTDGLKTLKISCTDTYGNVSVPATFAFVFDRTPPTISVSPGFSGTYVTSKSVPYNVTAMDSATLAPGVQYSLDGGAFKLGSVPKTMVDVTTDGPHSVVFRAIDGAGNTSTPTSAFAFSVDTEGPTVPTSFTFSQEFFSSIHVTWAPSTDANGGPISYQYRIGSTPDGSDMTAITRTSGTFVDYTTFANANGANPIYYLGVRALDAIGNASAWATFTRNWKADGTPFRGVGGATKYTRLLDTSRAALTSGAPTAFPFTSLLLAPGSPLVQSSSTTNTNIYTDFSQRVGGVFDAVCDVGGNSFPCAPGVQFTLPSYPLNTHLLVTIQIRRDGQLYNTIKLHVYPTSVTLSPSNPNGPVSPNMAFTASAWVTSSSDIVQRIWTSAPHVYFPFGTCGASGANCLVVVGDNSAAEVNSMNYNGVAASSAVYVGKGAALFGSNIHVADAYVSEGAIIEPISGPSSVFSPDKTPVRYHLLEGGVPGNPCDTPTPASCPADTTYIR